MLLVILFNEWGWFNMGGNLIVGMNERISAKANQHIACEKLCAADVHVQ